MLRPDKNGAWIDEALKVYIDKALEETTKLWKIRNDGKTISGGTFSKCRRQSWYKFFDEEKWKASKVVFDWFSKRIMFLGHRSEDIVFSAIRDAIKRGDLSGKLHTDQTIFPVNLRWESDGYPWAATLDGVVEDTLLWKGNTSTVYYPIELKQTDRPASSWWKRHRNKQPIRVYEGKATHRRQIIHYMNLARHLDIVCPYGILKYYRRTDYDTLTWIFYWEEYTDLVMDAFGDCHPEEYTLVPIDMLVEQKEQERLQHVIDLDTKSLPPQGTGLTSYDCDSCPYKRTCFAIDGDPRKKDTGRLKIK